jgi:hypothetical protein
MRNLLWAIKASALLLAAMFVSASFAHAQIVSISNNQSQSGSCSSGVGPGGTLCASSSNPFLLSDIENGSEVLTIPNTSSTPVWYVDDNISGTLSSLTLIFDGALASNANLQCNFGGGESGTCTVDGVTNGLSNPIFSGDLPATITFSGLSLTDGTYFEISTASFAAAGQDYGCVAGKTVAPGSKGGTTSCASVSAPEPGMWSMLAMSLLFITLISFRRLFRVSNVTPNP